VSNLGFPKPSRKVKSKTKSGTTKHGAAMKLADDMFSRLRRTEWAIETGSLEPAMGFESGYFRCVTCGNIQEIKRQGQCGHCIPRGVMKLRFCKTNTAGQCGNCNRFGNGQTILFLKSIREREGQEEHDRLVKIGESHDITKYNAIELLEMARSFQNEVIKIWHDAGLAYPWEVKKIPEC